MLGSVLGALAMGAEAQNATFNTTLMPQPAHVTVGSGSLALTPQFTVARYQNWRLNGAVERFVARLQFQTGLQIATPPDGSTRPTLTIAIDGPGEAVQGPDENETYSLEVTPNGAHLKAATVVGA